MPDRRSGQGLPRSDLRGRERAGPSTTWTPPAPPWAVSSSSAPS